MNQTKEERIPVNAKFNTENIEVFTVRLDANDVKQLSLAEVEALNERLKLKGVEPLTKIKRSSGDIEYVSKEAKKQLENDRMRRKQQKKLAEMRENSGYPKEKKDNRFVRALKELLK